LLLGPIINKILGKKTIAEMKLAMIVVMNKIPNWFRIATLQKTKNIPAKMEVKAPPKIVCPICLKASFVLFRRRL
jgi:hypothetical protein